MDLPAENLRMSVYSFYASCSPPKPHNFDHPQIKPLTYTVKCQYCWLPLHCHCPLAYQVIEHACENAGEDVEYSVLYPCSANGTLRVPEKDKSEAH